MGRIQRNPAYEKGYYHLVTIIICYYYCFVIIVNMGTIQRNPVYDNVVIVRY